MVSVLNPMQVGSELLLQTGGSSGGGLLGGAVALFFLLIVLAVTVVQIAGMWKVFEKAGQPGWGALIPILNLYYLVKIADRETWWLVLFFIPVLNLLAAIVVFIDVAENFGKGLGYGLGLAFLGVVFWPLLGFSDATYSNQSGSATI